MRGPAARSAALMRLIVADEQLRDRIQDATFPIWNEGLTRTAYGQWNDAQMRIAWGRERLHRLALMSDTDQWLASTKRYRFAARLDGESIEMVGVGAVFTPPGLRGQAYAQRIIEEMLAEEASRGTALAALFSEIGRDYYQRVGFLPVPVDEVTLAVRHKPGAPAVLVRSGTDADLAHITAMHEDRAVAARFALVRSPDLIQFSIAKKRLLAGLGPPGRRQTQFFVAEEGVMAVAYVVITIDERGWFIEEAGDRDPAAARLGAMLQVLLAREPAERTPSIRAWWPAGFPVPPQVTIESRAEAADVFMVRPLRTGIRPLSSSEVFYWRSDYF
jgi:GNAT superfamily N-acetyltransferase